MSGWGTSAPVDSTAGEGAAEGIDIRADGYRQRKKRVEVVHTLSVFEEEALLE